MSIALWICGYLCVGIVIVRVILAVRRTDPWEPLDDQFLRGMFVIFWPVLLLLIVGFAIFYVLGFLFYVLGFLAKAERRDVS